MGVGIAVSVGSATIVSAAIVDAIETAVAPMSIGGVAGVSGVALHAFKKVVNSNIVIISFTGNFIKPFSMDLVFFKHVEDYFGAIKVRII